MNVTDAVKAFLLYIEASGCRPRTIDTYRQRLRSLTAELGDRQVDDIQAVDLDVWVVHLRRQGKRWTSHPVRKAREGGLSDATLAGRIQSARAFFNYCVERRLVAESPAAHLHKPRVHPAAGEKAMSIEDLARLVDAAEKKAAKGKPRDLALLNFLVETGARAGETASLTLSHLDLETCEARVEGKTGRRVVDFTEATANAMRAWLAVRPDVDHEFVFVSRQGRPLTTRGMYGALRRLATKGGVEGRFNPHSIRHLVGQTWADQVNLELVRLKLGHSDIHTTAMFYANQDLGRVKAATRRLTLIQDGGEKS